MPFAIGLRFYKIQVKRKGQDEALTIGPDGEPCDLLDFMAAFVKARTDPTVETKEPRTWFFEQKETTSIRTIQGYLNYGTHGFESKFKDVKTRKEKYSRETSDLEEIPLYFQIWVPSGSQYALMAFQSFQGRSCVSYVRPSMVRFFSEFAPGYTLHFSIVTQAASFYDEAPVKTVTFYKPRLTSDRSDHYFLGRPVDEIDYQVTLRAKARNSILARYKDLQEVIPVNSGGVIEFNGEQFESVRADIKLGRKRRSVGIYGTGSDAGLIDVTDDVKQDKTGHPDFDSIANEVDELMEEFHHGMKT